MGLLGSLSRAGLLHDDQPTVHQKPLARRLPNMTLPAMSMPMCWSFIAPPRGVPTQTAFSQNRRFDDVDDDRKNGVIRDADSASKDGGLAVLYGNLAENGCIVKTAAVAEECYEFTGSARVLESQDAAVDAIMANDNIKPGDVVVIRYEGRRVGRVCRKCSIRPAI